MLRADSATKHAWDIEVKELTDRMKIARVSADYLYSNIPNRFASRRPLLKIIDQYERLEDEAKELSTKRDLNLIERIFARLSEPFLKMRGKELLLYDTRSVKDLPDDEQEALRKKGEEARKEVTSLLDKFSARVTYVKREIEGWERTYDKESEKIDALLKE